MRAFANLKACALLFQPFFHLLRVHGQNHNSYVVFIKKINSVSGFYSSHAPVLVVIHKYHKARHSGRESVARVGRNPDYRDVFEIAIHGPGYPLPGGYDGLLEHLCITMSAPAWRHPATLLRCVTLERH